VRRLTILRSGVDVLLDVGANTGQYAQIIPAVDDAWEARRPAPGEKEGTATIHVSQNSYSSSLLPMLERHVVSAPGSVPTTTESVPICRLDSIAPELVGRSDLKIDVQGSELNVLRGAECTLEQAKTIDVELSLLPLYAGQPLITEVVDHLDTYGFALVALERGFRDLATGQLLQLNGVFVHR
jgi:FkbM family methyltransferase